MRFTAAHYSLGHHRVGEPDHVDAMLLQQGGCHGRGQRRVAQHDGLHTQSVSTRAAWPSVSNSILSTSIRGAKLWGPTYQSRMCARGVSAGGRLPLMRREAAHHNRVPACSYFEPLGRHLLPEVACVLGKLVPQVRAGGEHLEHLRRGREKVSVDSVWGRQNLGGSVYASHAFIKLLPRVRAQRQHLECRPAGEGEG